MMGQSKSLESGAHEPDLAYSGMCVCVKLTHSFLLGLFVVGFFLLIFPNILLWKFSNAHQHWFINILLSLMYHISIFLSIPPSIH